MLYDGPQTLGDIVSVRAAEHPDDVFMTFEEATLTFGELDQQAESLAAALANLGVAAGDRIALVLPACPEFAVAMFAAGKLAGSAGGSGGTDPSARPVRTADPPGSVEIDRCGRGPRDDGAFGVLFH